MMFRKYYLNERQTSWELRTLWLTLDWEWDARPWKQPAWFVKIFKGDRHQHRFNLRIRLGRGDFFVGCL